MPVMHKEAERNTLSKAERKTLSKAEKNTLSAVGLLCGLERR